MPHCMIPLIPYINWLNRPWIKCLFLMNMEPLSPQLFSYWPFQGGSLVAVLLCLSVSAFICVVCFVIICSSLLLLMPREDCASWLWYFLSIFTYILAQTCVCKTRNRSNSYMWPNQIVDYWDYARLCWTPEISRSLSARTGINNREKSKSTAIQDKSGSALHGAWVP